jgi:hypothetical protein
MQKRGAVYCAPGCKRSFHVSECSGRKGGEGGGGSLQNLHAMVPGVSHDHAPVAVDGNAAKRVVELPVA